MKPIYKILALAAAILAVCSCFPDDRNNFQPDELVYLLGDKLLAQVDVKADSIAIVIVKSGKGTSVCDVEVMIDEELLDKYNEENGENLVTLGDNVMSLSETSVHFGAGDVRKVIYAKWNSTALSVMLTLQQYAIPLSIKADPLEISEGRSSIIIQPLNM